MNNKENRFPYLHKYDITYLNSKNIRCRIILQAESRTAAKELVQDIEEEGVVTFLSINVT